MRGQGLSQELLFTRSTKTNLSVVALSLALIFVTQAAYPQSFQVIHNFQGESDGANPWAGVTLDGQDNLYGTTSAGGSADCDSYGLIGCGTVFKLSRHAGGWILATLHLFTNDPDGANPTARVVFGPGNVLFGTTSEGGQSGYGTAFQLQPPPTTCPTTSCPWLETQLYSFTNTYSAANPGPGDVIFDSQGNLYGTSGGGGYLCDDGICGTVYKLEPHEPQWFLDVWAFSGGVSCQPLGELLAAGEGLYYGTTSGFPGGIFDFNGRYLDSFYVFNGESSALGGLISDSSGNLYGTTSQGGTGGGGIVFEYVPGSSSITTLYNFTGPNQYGAGPTATLLMDAAGNLYGTTQTDGANQQGSVFKLSQSNGMWTMTDLHDFTGGADGGMPYGQLTMDANGNIYGTTKSGGNSVGNCYQGLGCGVVFEITPD